MQTLRTTPLLLLYPLTKSLIIQSSKMHYFSQEQMGGVRTVNIKITLSSTWVH